MQRWKIQQNYGGLQLQEANSEKQKIKNETTPWKQKGKRPGQKCDPFLFAGELRQSKKVSICWVTVISSIQIGKNQERQSKNGLFYRLTPYYVKKEITFWVIPIFFVNTQPSIHRQGWGYIEKKLTFWVSLLLVHILVFDYSVLITKILHLTN